MAGDTPSGAHPWWKAPWTTAWIGIAVAVLGVIVTILALRSPGADSEPDNSTPDTSTPDNSTPDKAFVYGTMKPGHRFYPTIDEFIAETKPASVSGALFDTGLAYPAAVFDSGDGPISGYLLRWTPGQEAAANATIADVENNLFRPVRVRTGEGDEAIAYEYIGDTDDLTPIPAGDWTLQLEAQGDP